MSTSYYHTNHHHSPTPTIHHLIQKRANAISSIPFSLTTTTFIDSPSPLIAPSGMGIVEVSPTASSPSLYSRVGHSNSPQIHARTQMIKTSRKLQVLSQSEMTHRYSAEDDPYHHEEEEEGEEEDPRRMSMVGGPRVRKYTQVPWEEEDSEAQWSMVTQNTISDRSQAGGVTVVGSADMFSGFNRSKSSTTPGGYGRNLRSTEREREQSTISTTSTMMSSSDSPSLNVSSTRRGLAQIKGATSNKDKDNNHAKHLVPSVSGLSLASNQTSSTSSTSSFLSDSTPITPKLKSTNVIQISHSPLPNISDKKDKRIDTFHQGEYENLNHTSAIGLLPAVIPKSTVLSTYKKPQSPLIDNLTLTPTPGPTGFAANDRPLMNSGSPGFGLISLEAAQERERQKSQSQSQNQNQNQTRSHETFHTQSSTHSRSTTFISVDQQKRPLTTFLIPPIPDDPNVNVLRPTTSCTSASSPPNKVKSKKSGLMRLFNKSEKDKSVHSNIPVPALPHTTNSTSGNGPTMTPSLKGRDGVSSRAMSIWSSSTTNENPTSTSMGIVHGESAVWPSSSLKMSQGVLPHGGQGEDEEKRQFEVSSSSTSQPKLELRPISMTFSRGLPVDYLVHLQPSHTKRNHRDEDPSPPSVPCTPTSSMTKKKPIPADEEVVNNKMMMNVKKAFTIQIYELEAQIRELKDELKDARARKVLEGNCDKCGCTCNFFQDQDDKDDNMLLNVGSNTSGNGNGNRKVIDRARVKTAGARGVFGSGSLYEWE
ncbi:uncharacterized protein L199_008307 [Kwoniella botswanensis]|uniref:uncharacterized protein n=1 Tax=Kwoniella botswanensis TaxID=1268659 RepID=UPI00315D0849